MMMLSPLMIFWLIVAGVGAVSTLAYFRYRFAGAVSLVVSGVSLIGWLLLAERLPWAVTISEGGSAYDLPSWSWRVDELTWQLTALLLLLVVGVAVNEIGAKHAANRVEASQETDSKTPRASRSAAFILALATTGLITLWADSLAGLMAGWMLLITAWSATLIMFKGTAVEVRRSLSRLGWLLLSVFFLWWAAATAPVDDNGILLNGDWQRIPMSAILTAALFQLGVWPFHGWRPTDRPLPPGLAALLYGVPALVGASLLVRLVAISQISMGYSLFLTGFGLLGLFWSVYRTWSQIGSPVAGIANLALAPASLALLAGVWAGVDAMVAETRVLVLAMGILFFTAGRLPVERTRWWDVIAPGIALAALAGVPLTAGFAGRVRLYATWLDGGRLTLLIVSGLLVILLMTVAARLTGINGTAEAPHSDANISRRSEAARLIGTLILAAGLLSVDGISVAIARPTAFFLALIPPVIASILLFRFGGELDGAGLILKRALPQSLTVGVPAGLLQRVMRQLSQVVQDATAILEGEGGLLWLFVLVLALVLAW